MARAMTRSISVRILRVFVSCTNRLEQIGDSRRCNPHWAEFFFENYRKGLLDAGKMRHFERRILKTFLTARHITPTEEIGHAYYKYYVFVRPENLKDDWSRDRIMEAINAEGIPCFAGYREMYLEKAFPAEWRPPQPLPVTQRLSETGLQFLVHSTLCDADMFDTCRAVEKVMEEATRWGRNQYANFKLREDYGNGR